MAANLILHLVWGATLGALYFPCDRGNGGSPCRGAAGAL
jgi:hypothetical protein